MARVKVRAGAAAAEAAAFDRRRVFAHTVHLVDIGAATQQIGGQRLFIGESDTVGRQRQQRRAAARQRHHHIVGAKAPGQLIQPPGGRQASGVGHRMGGLDHFDHLGRASVAITGDHQTFDRPARMGGAPGALECARHRPAGLAGTDRPRGRSAARPANRRAPAPKFAPGRRPPERP